MFDTIARVGKGINRKLVLADVLDALQADGMILAGDADELRATQGLREKSGIHPLSIIANQHLDNIKAGKGKLTLEALTVWFADHVSLPYLRIDPLKIDVPTVTQVVPYAYAASHGILPVKVSSQTVTFAVYEPYQTEWMSEMEHVLQKKIERVIVNPEDISRYLIEFYNLSKSVLNAADQNRDRGGLQNLEQLIEMGRSGKLDANDHHVVSIVDWLLQYAFEQRASDIHMEPRRDQGNIRFRIDGVLHNVYELPPPVMAAVTSRLKILGRMDLAEKRRPQDGRVKTRTPDGVEIELRLSTMPTTFGEKLVMRIFDPDVLVKDFKALGFGNKDIVNWHKMIKQPHGIILVTGPTGSGKTTTLYSTLKQLAKPEINVCTVEDPIEMVEPSFNQMQVQANINLTFASGIRTLLRQDPDIVMVGEIRDHETAEMATQAALTGHLVFSTLHTNDAASAITRLLEIGIPSYLLKATLIGVVAQRLVRTLCPHCKEQTTISDDDWQSLVHPWKMAKPEIVYQPAGCLECRMTGYMGRTGLYEMLNLTSQVKALIRSEGEINEIEQQAFRDGMRPLRISGAEKIASGMTTPDEVFKVIPPAISE